MIGETIPGGTTTALGVLTSLGEQPTVPSSLPDNPLSVERDVVVEALDASGLSSGSTAGNPIEAVRYVGDPVLAVVAGSTAGATDAGKSLTLVGGTRRVAAAALVRHAGPDASLSLAPTSLIAPDTTAGIHELADDIDVAVTVTDPGYDSASHPAMDASVAGGATEGVGTGGVWALADAADVSMAAVPEKFVTVSDGLLGRERTAKS